MEEILAYNAGELFFWGICYGTGYIITPIISFGYWKPGQLESDKKLRKEKRKHREHMFRKESGVRYLDADGVVIVGFGFWITIGAIAIVYAINT
jgi:hypothetical protein